jgi:lipid-binding SYLF domain-containing protein
MKKWLALCAGGLLLSLQVAANEDQITIEQFQRSSSTTEFFANAYGYAVFPTIGKGGIGLGGAYGEGQVYLGGRPTGSVNMIQISLGFQLGGQAFSQIIFLQDKRAYDAFTAGSFEFGAQVSAVALTYGTSAQAGSTGTGAALGNKQSKANYIGGFAIFTLAKGGLMYEASIAGQKFNFKAAEPDNKED